jgi:hypothetical protein
MIINNFKSSVLVLAGIVIGCGAAVSAPETFTPNSASASDPGGSWACYRANDFDNKDLGRGEDGAKKAEMGLNQIAPHAERGRIVTLPTQVAMGDLHAVVCVKH